MKNIFYTKEHEWLKLDNDTATIGITIYAQDQLGDVVFVELPNINNSYKQGDEVGVVESVKAASEIYAPISGSIIEINDRLSEEAGLLNSDPEGEGWLWKMNLSNINELAQLMSKDKYSSYIKDI
ncbi:glycine cleavage system protein GcvH [Alphaproteobacteria bacterium]|nr:glycine cleavage system protein GcvH [Alphaproteobacteria bacterium]